MGKENPEQRAGFVSRVTFSWLNPLLRQGAAHLLQERDLWALPDEDAAIHVREQLLDTLEKNKATDGGLISKPALWRALWQAFGPNMVYAGVYKFASDGLGLAVPICINALIKYVEDPSSAWFNPQYFGFVISATLFVASILQSLTMQQQRHLVIREAIRVRSAIIMIVYEKALTLSSQTKSTLGSGKILNLATVDANRVFDFLYIVHYIWAAPLQFIIGTLLLLHYLGLAAFAGIAIMVLLLPLSIFLSAQAAFVSKKLLGFTDSRLKLLNEILRHIRVIKFYSWETEMLNQVEDIREQEVGMLKTMVIWNAFSQVALQAGPVLVSLASFAVYSWIEAEPLTPDAAFTSITLFSIFRLPLMALPRIFSLLFQADVSVERLSGFMSVKGHAPLESSASEADPRASPTSMGIRDASFSWHETDPTSESAESASTLPKLNVRIPKGKLTVIVGPVGSGKSTLLAALLRELRPTDGHVNMPTDKVSYAAQTPYVVNASVRDNIVFGSVFDFSRLNRVIDGCELRDDLALLSDGLQTELGENGINLSGGQKQRVSIARAVYRTDQNIYVFDDALSALDAKVASRIFQQCFQESSGALLAGQTRVLATHALHFAKFADWIIVMDKMQIVQMGTYEDLTSRNPEGVFASMLQTYGHGSSSVDGSGQASVGVVSSVVDGASVGEETVTPGDDEQKKEVSSQQQQQRLIEDESRAVGSVALDVFASYYRSCGVEWCIGAFGVLIAAQMSQVSTDLWLARWTSTAITSTYELAVYLDVYAYLSFITIALAFAGDLSCRFAGLSASRVIHHRLLRHIIKGTMRFFDTTPIGRILNRFSNDMTTIDQKLNASIISFITILLSLVSMLVIQSSSVPLLLALLLPVFTVYYLVQHFYRQSCRELQRLDSVTKSPIYAHFTETLHGLVTIRAFQMVPASVSGQAKRIDQNTRAFLSLNLINRWLGVRLESLGALITLGVACFVTLDHWSISSAMAGLLLSYSQNITGALNWIVRNNIDMENMMNSVERTDEYSSCEVDVEDLELDDWEVSRGASHYLSNRPMWPEWGQIRFVNVHVRYHAAGELVLRNVSFDIEGGERVGICGRTGAGKSSLLLTLFRLVRCDGGRIEIDGVDISQLQLHELRSRIAIIPQDPVLFASSIRFNLDPTGEADDETLWEVVKRAHLYSFVSGLPGKLDEPVLEGGENCSLGERQLICLARAILRNSRILCLDEATASMDHATDALIQSSIRQEFKRATVLTIAHRVQTIADYDKVLVLKRGRVAEFDTPARLLANPQSEFATMMHSGHV
ncbi:hypothetical protein Poli38472_009167 [Pythium oligandrum]|uniref:Uncharacterized protein n=1 Tax=Pythium oligandrum TaxID=41045 RepID=A0A8K1CLT9_PYTOL|nr:hypothetical protein Poli38472_009167 [Pythium oligandrum]|eukprot:TMW65000.1 hypothetical protein Poli38472_009167 [Pythium oligandrum]